MPASIDVLALSPQRTSTSDLLADAARARGVAVRVIDDASEARRSDGERVAYYGGPIFGARVASALDVALLTPPDDFLQTLPAELVGRRVEAVSASEARWLTRPFFAKPPSDKSFDAGVFADGSRLPALPPEAVVQVSEIVTFAEEHRLFLLDGAVHAASRYARFGRLDPGPATDAALGFGGEVAKVAQATPGGSGAGDAEQLLPSAVVVDVGLVSNPDTGAEHWAVVEANMAWFAHCYAAEPAAVLDVIAAAAGPRTALRDADRSFVAVSG